MRVIVAYTDGTRETGPPESWADFCSAGVEYVDVKTAAGVNRVQGHSVYWLYREDDSWVVGGGGVGPGYGTSPLRETVIDGDGRQDVRDIDFMPDLPHTAAKLGWWSR